jgi:thiamine-phosphate pyrophosphorylase
MEEEHPNAKGFLVAVITSPQPFDGETEQLESLLEAGLQKLHLRRPSMREEELEPLLELLAPRWKSRLVLHASEGLASRYGVPQIHRSSRLPAANVRQLLPGGEIRGANGRVDGDEPGGDLAISTSVHSWPEMLALPAGLAYSFISPLFDSISKPGYTANKALLKKPRAAFPCKAIGLGGMNVRTVRELVRRKWEGAALLGWIWERPDEAVARYCRVMAAVEEDQLK